MSNSEQPLIVASREQLEWPKILEILTDHGTTPMAKQIAHALQPTQHLETARTLLRQTSELVDLVRSGDFRCNFSDVVDCTPVLRKTEKGGYLLKEELFQLLITLRSAESLMAALKPLLAADSALLPLIKPYTGIEDLTLMLEELVDHRGEIRDNASPKLASLRARLRELNANVQNKLKALLQTNFGEEYFQDDYITLREDRLVLPMKANMKGRIDGIIHGSSNTGQTYFIEPAAVVDDNNAFKEACRDEQIEIERILREASRVIRDYTGKIDRNMRVVVDIDLALARAKLSIAINGNVPRLTTDPEALRFAQARHPLLALMGKNVVANDIDLPAGCYCLLISGPNAGGKTVTLKTVGLNVLLASAGILPAVGVGSTLPLCDRLLVDIGDRQSLEEGLSTFGAHLKVIAQILELATPRSLVLLDEILSGTNAVEGEALGQALLEKLAQKRAKTLVSTHYPNLKKLPDQNPAFMNASMETQPKSGRPTYKLAFGVAGSSNAVTMAKNSGLDTAIIERAKELLGPAFKEQEARQTLEDEFAARKEALDKRTADLQRREAEFLKRLSLLENNSLEELLQEHLEFKQQLAEARRRLREITPTLQPAKAMAAQKTLDRVAESVQDAVQSEPAVKLRERIVPDVILKSGDKIRLLESEQIAEVTREADKHGLIEVRVGALRMKLHREELSANPETAPGPASKPKLKAKTDASRPAEEIPFTTKRNDNTLDLRGKSLDEAINAVQRFVDRASLDGPDALLIIHGHGGDKLKKGVRGYLQSAPYALSFRSGQGGEGGDGVTVVLLEK